MKTTLFSVLLLATTICFAQSINQFDANGKRHGKWQKNFDGTSALRYQGQFDHGKEVGTFTYYQKVGKVSKIAATKEFNTTDNTAKVKFVSLRGMTISEGTMNGKKYVGKWLYYHKNSDKLMTEEFYTNNGNLDGKRTVYYDTGTIAEVANYVNGKFQGESNYYALNGTLVKQYIYKDNELHGPTRHYEENGTVSIEGQYQNGHKHGIWKYYRNGKIYDEKDFTRRTKNPNKQ